MALGVVEGCQCKRRCCVGDEVPKYGQYTRIIGRKRVMMTPQSADDLPFSSPTSKPFKRRPKKFQEAVNRLEMLPQDVLIHVLCRVHHSSLKHLILLSKAIHNAAVVAKKTHFDFRTPNSKLRKLAPEEDSIENLDELQVQGNHETPNAPMRAPRSTKLGCKDLSSITVALFKRSSD